MNKIQKEIKEIKREILIILGVILALLIFSSYFMGFSTSEIFRRSRDSQRIKELKTLENLILQYLNENQDMDGPYRENTCIDQSSPTVYVSIPSDSHWQLPDLPPGWRWGQTTQNHLQETNGLGWLPLDFSKNNLKKLFIDPLNTANPLDGRKNFFYIYICKNQTSEFQIATKLESLYYGIDYFGSGGKNDMAYKDGGKFAGLYEVGNNLNLLPDDGIFCPAGMVWIGVNKFNSGFCIDAYEVSWSEGNKPISAPNQNPWSSLPENIFPYVNQELAQKYCQLAGKRLPTNYEWFLAARDTPDELFPPAMGEEACHHWNSRSDLPQRVRKPKEAVWQDTDYQWSIYNKGFIKTGTAKRCRSAYGAFDMIGNLFEFTLETQSQRKYKNISLPKRNYITLINEEGIPIETSEEPSIGFDGDYFWLDNEEEHIFLRGGSWFDEEKAGAFSLNLILRKDFGDYNVGFRCVL